MINLHIYPSPFTRESRILRETAVIAEHCLFDRIIMVGVCAPGLPDRERVDDRREIWRFPRDARSGLVGKLLTTWRWAGLVYQAFRREKVGCVNCHSLPVLGLCVKLARATRAKLVYDTHELETETNGLGGLRKLLSKIVERRLDTLDAALELAPLVVNTTGLGARELVDDDEVYAVRGQIVVCEQIGLDRVWLDEHDPAGTTYIIPRAHDIVLGGVADEHDERLGEDLDQSEAIVRRCVAIEPALAHAKRLGVRVGLRPCRPSVRLELQQLADGGKIIHDYGHGGAGVTVSWGCADEVLALAD